MTPGDDWPSASHQTDSGQTLTWSSTTILSIRPQLNFTGSKFKTHGRDQYRLQVQVRWRGERPLDQCI